MYNVGFARRVSKTNGTDSARAIVVTYTNRGMYNAVVQFVPYLLS